MKVYLMVTMLCDHAALIPHFLRHYLDLGIEPQRFLITLNVKSSSDPSLARATEILATFGIKPCHFYFGVFDIVEDHAQTLRLKREFTEPEDWMICCDLDEFQEYPTTRVASFLEKCQDACFDFVQGTLVDHLAPAGELRTIANAPSIWKQFPIESDVSHRLGAAETSKVMAHRCSIDTLPGHHWTKNEGMKPAAAAPEILRVHHFKWDASAVERFEFAAHKQRNPFWAATSARFLDHIQEWGRINLDAIPPVQPMQPLPLTAGEISFGIDLVEPPPAKLHAHKVITLKVRIHNHTGALLTSQDPAPIFFCYHWLAPDRSIVIFDGQRSPLLPPLPAKSSQEYLVVLEAPERTGNYFLQLTLVQERFRWLENFTRSELLPVEIANSQDR